MSEHGSISEMMSEADQLLIGSMRAIEVDGIRATVWAGEYHVQPMFTLHPAESAAARAYLRADLPMSEHELDLWVRDGCLPEGHAEVRE